MTNLGMYDPSRVRAMFEAQEAEIARLRATIGDMEKAYIELSDKSTLYWQERDKVIDELHALKQRELSGVKPSALIAYRERDEARRERDAWMRDAAKHCRNEDFYRGLVSGIGAQFGKAAYTSDDGSVQQDVICLKVPEMVAALRERVKELKKENAMFRETTGRGS